jgi:hypothetical protein
MTRKLSVSLLPCAASLDDDAPGGMETVPGLQLSTMLMSEYERAWSTQFMAP